jgi:hypothetical protein
MLLLGQSIHIHCLDEYCYQTKLVEDKRKHSDVDTHTLFAMDYGGVHTLDRERDDSNQLRSIFTHMYKPNPIDRCKKHCRRTSTGPG